MSVENVIIIVLSAALLLLLLFVATRKKRSTDDEMSGTEFEDYCAEILAKRGYEIEQMTAVTGDYGADIIISRDNVRIAVQCKRYSRPVGVKAVQEAAAARDYYKCRKAAVITNSTFTKQAQTLALETDVMLWDGDFINETALTNGDTVAPEQLTQVVFAPVISQEAVICRLYIDSALRADGEFAEPLILSLENGAHEAVLKIGHRKARLQFTLLGDGRKVFVVSAYKKKPLLLEIGI